MPEDLLFFYDHLRRGGGVVRVDQSLLLYRFRPGAATQSILEYVGWGLGAVGGAVGGAQAGGAETRTTGLGLMWVTVRAGCPSPGQLTRQWRATPGWLLRTG